MQKSTRGNLSVHLRVGCSGVYCNRKHMHQEAGEVHSRSGSTTEELCHCQLEQTFNQLLTSFFLVCMSFGGLENPYFSY